MVVLFVVFIFVFINIGILVFFLIIEIVCGFKIFKFELIKLFKGMMVI